MKKLIIAICLLAANTSTAVNTQYCTQVDIYSSKTKQLLVNYKIDLARTQEDKSKGLMFVESMPRDKGMLFVWQDLGHRAMWMKNTYIPLDMIFINDDKIVGLVKNAVPHSLEPRKVKAPSNKILEINFGELSKHKIKVGDSIFCK